MVIFEAFHQHFPEKIRRKPAQKLDRNPHPAYGYGGIIRASSGKGQKSPALAGKIGRNHVHQGFSTAYYHTNSSNFEIALFKALFETLFETLFNDRKYSTGWQGKRRQTLGGTKKSQKTIM
jgi:hypothetical protein